jgi:hypothetical protein
MYRCCGAVFLAATRTLIPDMFSSYINKHLHEGILQYNTYLSLQSVRRDKYKRGVLIHPRVEETEMRLALNSSPPVAPNPSKCGLCKGTGIATGHRL